MHIYINRRWKKNKVNRNNNDGVSKIGYSG